MDIFLVEPQATLLWEKSRKFDLRLDARAQARVSVFNSCFLLRNIKFTMDIFSVEPRAALLWKKQEIRPEARCPGASPCVGF